MTAFNPGGPLSGIRVLALELAVAGPLCTRHLVDLGADVIKIERPGGGDFARGYDKTVHGQSSYFVWLNRGKRSLALDLKHESAPEILARLLEQSDVLVQNLGPGAIDRLGLAPATLRERYPSLVICSISGYGSGGPYETRKAFDLLLQGETGVIATTGNGDDLAKVGISVGDVGAGVYGAMSTLAALYERQQTGQGRLVETSLFDALTEWMGYPAYYTKYGGIPPARAGVRHATVVPYGSYRCGDGQAVLLAVQTEAQWSAFCTIVCGHPEWIDDPRFNSSPHRREHRGTLEAMIEDALSAFDRAEVTRRLEAADIPYGDLNDVQQFVDHPQLTGRNRWRDVDSPGGPFQALLPPMTLEGFECRMDDIPAVGQHSDEVLAEVGFGADEIAALSCNEGNLGSRTMYLTNLTTDDLELYVGLLCDPIVMAELGGPLPIDGIPAKLARDAAAADSGTWWALKIMIGGPDDRPVGTINVWDDPESGLPGAEIGWMVLPAYQGQGYASRAVAQVLERERRERRWGEIHAFTTVTNVASNALARRNGFQLLGEEEIDYLDRMLICNHWRYIASE